MARIIYPNSQSLSGPWILDRNALDSLAEILDESWKSMTLARERDIEMAVDQEPSAKGATDAVRAELRKKIAGRYRFETHRRSLHLRCKSKKTIEAQSLRDAFDDPALRNETVSSLQYEAQCGEHECDITLGQYGGSELTFSASPIESSPGSQTFAKLETWATALRAPPWVRWWREFAGFHWLIFVVLLAVLPGVHTTGEQLYKAEQSQQALSLSQAGINESNVNKAVQLLLERQFGIYPSTLNAQLQTNNRRFLLILTVVISVCFILSFPPPRILLGIGQKQHSVARVRFWVQLVTVTIPTIVVTTFLWPFIVERITTIFSP